MTDVNMTDSQTTPPYTLPTPSDLEMLKRIVDAAEERRAENVVALDLSNVSSSLEFFVICSATAGLQINAVVQNVRSKMAEAGVRIQGVEGPSDRWTLMNFGSTVVHVMTKEAREYYDLEGLWNDAEVLEIGSDAAS